MSIRSRFLILGAIIGIVPIAFLAWIFRAEMTSMLTRQYERRADGLLAVIDRELDRRNTRTGEGLAALAETMKDDNRLRRALGGDARERAYLLDYASRAKNLLGLDMLQIQDGRERIVSSGHFRNEFDRLDEGLPRSLSTLGGKSALVRARRPEGGFLALARLESLSLGGEPYYLVGGVEVDRRFLKSLVPDDDMRAMLLAPGHVLVTDGREGTDDVRSSALPPVDPGLRAIRREIGIPMIGRDGKAGPVRLIIAHDGGPLARLLGRFDRWFRVGVGIAAAGALVLALWISMSVSRPIRRLAAKAASLDLDRLDARFDEGGRDEVGTLSRLLGEMTGRLRASALRIRESERRATLGDIARQVNHDLRNGLTPLRNVFRHLVQVGRDEPDRLAAIFEERRGTIDSGLSYLEELSRNYSRLSTKGVLSPCDLNRIVRDLAGALGAGGAVRFIVKLDRGVPPVLAEPTGLRRIVENLVANAVESLSPGGGTVVLTTGRADGGDGAGAVRLGVKDDGCGMDGEKRERMFDHFFTDKEGGSGLGLSIVRRLVTDFEGTIDVKSEPGRGTFFTVVLPAAPGGTAVKEASR